MTDSPMFSMLDRPRAGAFALFQRRGRAMTAGVAIVALTCAHAPLAHADADADSDGDEPARERLAQADDRGELLLPERTDDEVDTFRDYRPVVPGSAALREVGYREGSPIDIGLVLDLVADIDLDDDVEAEFPAREFLELNLGASVDPYFDARATIGFEPDGGVEVEEAFVSTILPGNLLLQVGREYVPFGYLNRIHVHDYPQVDVPFVLDELTTDHGYIGNGGHLEWLAPFENPTLQATVGIYSSIEHSVGRRIDGYPLVGRLQSFWESGDGNHGVLLGVSALTGIADRDGRNGNIDARTFAQTQYVLGADARYRWQPTQERRGAILGAEVLRQVAEVDSLGAAFSGQPSGARIRDWGMYAFAHYDFNPFYGAGYRFDYTDELLSDGDDQLIGHSIYGEWRPSEFSRLRAQYQIIDNGDTEHRLLLQATFFLGWHPPHTF